MESLDSFATFLLERDRASYYALAATRKMHAEAIGRYSRDIFKFLEHTGVSDIFEKYAERIEGLRTLQAEFEQTGRYRAASSREVKPISDERYKLALLLSFVCTN